MSTVFTRSRQVWPHAAPTNFFLTNSSLLRHQATDTVDVGAFGQTQSDSAMTRTSKPRCRLYYNEDMMKHTHEWPHIEKCTRARSAYDHLSQAGLIARCEELPGRAATDAELLTAHSQNHLDEVAAITQAVVADPTNRKLRGESLGPTLPPVTSFLSL